MPGSGRRLSSAGTGIRALAALALLAASGCASLPSDPLAPGGPLRSLQRALRGRLPAAALDPRDVALLRERHRFADEDLQALEARLAGVLLPDGSVPVRRPDGDDHVLATGEEVDAFDRARAACERNVLLADLVERGAIERVLACLRDWPEIRRKVMTNEHGDRREEPPDPRGPAAE